MENTIHVEVCQKAESTLPSSELKNLILNEIVSYSGPQLLDDEVLASQANLKDHVDSIVSTAKEKLDYKDLTGKVLRFHIYRLTEEDAASEVIGNDNNEGLPAISEWILPAREFYGLWENLYFDSNVKDQLLSFVETAMLFAKYNVNPNVIGFNRVVLLHGPPGTGKTSLCKALAQKVVVRMADEFTNGELIEINSHSLFSKWFSESGKLVMQLFNGIKERLERRNTLVCILIDEVESLAHVRKACQNGTEPTDSIRVVNALLTQLDQIKRYPNALILTTSNLTEAVDLAFLDRADIKQYIGHMKPYSIYKIYKSCLDELMRVKLIPKSEVLSPELLSPSSKANCESQKNCSTENSEYLSYLCMKSEGLSGRTLRKIPFLSYVSCAGSVKCVSEFLDYMKLVIFSQMGEPEAYA